MRSLGNRERKPSLRSRIVWSTALISAVAVAAMAGTIVLVLNAVIARNVDATLRDRLTVLASEVATDSDPASALDTPSDSIDDTTWLFDADGAQLAGPRAREFVQEQAERLRAVTKETTASRGERRFLAAPVAVGPSGGQGVLVVSQSTEPYETTRGLALAGIGLLGVLVTAGTTAVAAWTVRRTLEPVESMAALARDWSAHALDARFDDSPGGDEVAELGVTLNVLLDRVAGALRGEQRLTSELAHELRTPLTAIRGEAELALMGTPSAPTGERLATIVTLTEQMTDTIRTLLDLARADLGGDTHSTTFSDVVAAVRAAVDAGRAADRVPVTVREPSDVVRIGATTELVVRALAPLVDNAEHHARTRVELACAVDSRRVQITVSDDGPGIDEPVVGSLFHAGTRGTDSPGAGLGLALARRVARTLGGDVELTSTSNPTTFTLSLPAH